jgi:hypothetical protein
VARVTLSPVTLNPQQASNLAAQNLTSLAAAGIAPSGTGAGNGVQFFNSPGQTLLLVSVGTTATTPTIVAGTVSAAVVLTALTVSTLEVLGPFYAAMFLSLTTQMVAVDFSSITNILCTAVQLAGIY